MWLLSYGLILNNSDSIHMNINFVIKSKTGVLVMRSFVTLSL